MQPPLDYQTPRPPKRLRFLSKCNRRATSKSVLRKALLTSLGGAGLRIFGALTKEGFWKTWPIALPALMLSGAISGAIFEWQVPNEDDEQNSKPGE